ncbi:hypothetical protein OUZ56_008503 [Daphnia magna]|uniref:Secreted protein n=1 Tax=Daphnia magna TaxID=35525 RepID=A0ABR0AD82_9CRUS|nr:hypothetical protein OUZ56_008503 [Daphnia magna]
MYDVQLALLMFLINVAETVPSITTFSWNTRRTKEQTTTNRRSEVATVRTTFRGLICPGQNIASYLCKQSAACANNTANDVRDRGSLARPQSVEPKVFDAVLEVYVKQ